MPSYHDLANELRFRILCGSWEVGTKIPSITELQKQHGMPSLNTVRAAQQKLVEEGMLETRQGVGAFVVSSTPLTSVDVQGELVGIRDRLTTVLTAMESQRLHRLTIDLDDPSEPHLHFVLTEALREWASAIRDRIANEPEVPNGHDYAEWADAAERLLQRVEDAL